MPATRAKLTHWVLLAGLLTLATIVVLVWSSRGLGLPDPGDIRRPVSQLAQNAERNRDAAITRLLLLCLDSLTKGKMAPTINSCDTVVAIDPNNGTALKLRGNAYLHLGLSEKAISDFSRAIHISAKDAEAYRFRAAAYAAQHRDALALADYNRAIALAPDDPINFQLRGYYYQVRNKFQLAIADFTSAIAKQPRLAAAWNSRCWTRAVAGIDLTGALSDCNRSLTLSPANANTLDSRGLVYLKLGKYRDAIKDYNDALGLSPRLASSLFGRGAAKLWIGDRTAARDIAAAKSIEPGIELRFLSYGIKLRASGPSGT